MTPTLAIGVTIKSGWALLVLLEGPTQGPIVRDARRIDLSDPSIPEARQPYHDGRGTARAEGPDLARPSPASIALAGNRSLRRFV